MWSVGWNCWPRFRGRSWNWDAVTREPPPIRWGAQSWNEPGGLPRIRSELPGAETLDCPCALGEVALLGTGQIPERDTTDSSHLEHLMQLDSMGMNLGKLWEMVRDREAWRAAIYGVTKSQTWLGNWTTTTTHSSILAGESCAQRSLAGCSPWDRKESDTT